MINTDLSRGTKITVVSGPYQGETGWVVKPTNGRGLSLCAIIHGTFGKLGSGANRWVETSALEVVS